MPNDAELSTVDFAWHDPELDSALRALPAGELAPALDLLASTRDQPDRRELCVEVLGQAGTAVLPALRAAATEQRDDADRMLLWGSALVAAAWFARGADDADHTTEEQFARLGDLTRQARATLTEAARLAPDDAVPWSALLWCALGDPADDDEGDKVFAQVQARAPELFGANAIRLQLLSAKWYGSNEAALEFARAGRRDVPAGHPLLALIPLAHLEVHIGNMMSGGLFSRVRKSGYLSKKPVRAEVDAASDWLHAGMETSATFGTHPMWYRVNQIFAVYYQQASEWQPEDRARIAGHVKHSGDRPAPWPWGYFGDPDEQFAKARKVSARAK